MISCSHKRFMDLGNLVKTIVHHLLIGWMTCLGRRDRVPMVSALVYMVTHWTGFTMNHDIRLSDNHDSLRYYIA